MLRFVKQVIDQLAFSDINHKEFGTPNTITNLGINSISL